MIPDSVQSSFAAINNAAGDFLSKLTGTDIPKDITIAAEMAGLMLLRSTSANGLQAAPGTVVLGAISDDAYDTLNRFVIGFAVRQKLNPEKIDSSAIPAAATHYLPELTQFEQPFYDVCRAHGLIPDHYPFAAAACAVYLVAAGKEMGILDEKIGLAIVLFHIAAGSKTIPYPCPSASARSKSD